MSTPSKQQTYSAPLTGNIAISAGYGRRQNYPDQGETNWHGGVDFVNQDLKNAIQEDPKQAFPVPVLAVADGDISYQYKTGGTGYSAVVTSPNGTVTQYAHLVPIADNSSSTAVMQAATLADAKSAKAMTTIIDKVRKTPEFKPVMALANSETTTVKQGDIIGFMGSTGKSTGFHLHVSMSTSSRGNLWDDQYVMNPEKSLPGVRDLPHVDNDAPAREKLRLPLRPPSED